MKDFKEWCEGHNVIDIRCSNGIHTWNNKQKDFTYIAEKLDNFFIKGDLEVNNLNIQSLILPIVGLDNFLVRLELIKPHKPTRNSFKCEKMWFLDSSFIENIKEWWSQGDFEGSKMFIFISKMKMLKENMVRWNKDHFNNIFKEKLEIEDRLKELNLEVIKYRMNNDSYKLEKDFLAKQEDILTKEEIFW